MLSRYTLYDFAVSLQYTNYFGSFPDYFSYTCGLPQISFWDCSILHKVFDIVIHIQLRRIIHIRYYIIIDIIYICTILIHPTIGGGFIIGMGGGQYYAHRGGGGHKTSDPKNQTQPILQLPAPTKISKIPACVYTRRGIIL